MENDFRSTKVWGNLDNPIKSYDFFFTVLINFLYAALSNGTLLQFMMSQQNNWLMELYTNFIKFYFSWKYIFPLLLYLGMLGPK